MAHLELSYLRQSEILFRYRTLFTYWKFENSDPERSFENNQLIGFSISLSPLNAIEMNDLHV
ncbi:hypothetical protein PFBG_03665, partial [Plasmodium falciparum 7G8]